MATVLIEYQGNVDGLKAAVSEVAKANEQISESAKQSSAEVASEYKKVAAAGKAAFASAETKKAIDAQASSVDKLKDQLELLYKEEVQLLASGKGLTEQYKKNREETAKIRAEFDKLLKVEQQQVQTTDKLNTSGKRLTSQMRELKEQLSRLEQEGKTNTKEFEKVAIAAAKLEDQIGDTQERVKALASDTFVFDAAIDSVSALAGGFAIAEGAVGLFADGNEELQQAIAKTNSLMAILNGLQQVQAFVTGQSAGKLALLNIAQKAYSVAVGTSVGAMRVFRLALIATGIGAAVVALGFLVTNFDKVKKVAYDLIPGLAGVGKFIGQVVDKTKELLGLNDDGEDLGVVGRLIKRQDILLKEQVNSLSRQIDIQKAYGKETTALEVKREQIQLRAAEKRLAFIKANEQALSNAIDTEQKSFELEQEIADRRNAIAILQIKKTNNINEEAKAYENLTLKVRDLNAELSRSFSVQIDESLQAELATRQKTLLQTQDLLKQGLATSEDVKTAETRVLLTEQRIQIQAIEDSAKQKKISAGDNSNEIIEIEKNKTAQIELINQQTTSKIIALDDDKVDSAKDANAKIEEDTKKTNDQIVKDIFAYADAISSVFNSIADLQKQQTEQRISAINQIRDADIEANNQAQISFAQRKRNEEAINLRANRKIVEEKRKQARLDKALGIFNATIDTAKAVVGFLSNPGGIPGIVLSVAAGIAGGVQIAKIASEPLPKFRKGGWVNGASHEGGGVHIEAEGGEFITRRGVAAQNRKELEAMNTSRAAFMRLIEERYVRPRLVAAMMDKKDSAMNVSVNASLQSEKMEGELKALRRETRNTGKVISKALSSHTSSRYTWN